MSNQTGDPVIRIDDKTWTVTTTYVSILAGAMTCFAALSLTSVIHNPSPPLTLVSIWIAAMAGCGAMILRVVRSRVVLHSDSIDVIRLLWSRRVARIDIVARRMRQGRWSSYHVLLTRGGCEVDLPPYLEHNTALRTWLASIPLASRKRSR
jgi:hypothetical protein